MSGKETKSQADFTFETVAILCSCLNNCTVTKAQYEMMSALDGTRTANAFQHQFRAVLKRARELKAKTDSGDTTMKPVEAEHKKGKAKKDGTVTSGKGTKNGKGDEKGTKRSLVDSNSDDQDQDNGEDGNAVVDEEMKMPSPKRIKKEIKNEVDVDEW